MQYEKLFKSKKNDPTFTFSSNHLDIFVDDLRFKDLNQEKSPPKIKTNQKTCPPTQREVLRNRTLEKISNQNLPGEDHLKKYIRFKFQRNCKPNTIRSSCESIVPLLVYIRDNSGTRLEDLSRSDLEGFVEQEQDRGVKPRTIRTRLACIYAFIRFLVDNRIVTPDLLVRKINIKLPKSLPKDMDKDDEEKLLSVIDDTRNRAMILLLLRTGMRIGELLDTKMRDINLEEQTIRIYESEKTGFGRVVYFSNDAAAALYDWLLVRDFWKERLFYGSSRKSLCYAGARIMFNKYIEKAGLSHRGYTLHCLRHTFATSLLNNRMPIEVLRDLLGHINLEQTQHYAKLSDKNREEEFFRAMTIIEGGDANGHD